MRCITRCLIPVWTVIRCVIVVRMLGRGTGIATRYRAGARATALVRFTTTRCVPPTLVLFCCRHSPPHWTSSIQLWEMRCRLPCHLLRRPLFSLTTLDWIRPLTWTSLPWTPTATVRWLLSHCPLIPQASLTLFHSSRRTKNKQQFYTKQC